VDSVTNNATNADVSQWNRDLVRPLHSSGEWRLVYLHKESCFDLIAAQPDLTLDEVMAAKKAAFPVVAVLWGVSSVAVISPLKKACTPPSSSERTWRVRAGVRYASKACLILRG
jgi:hypothetical protein